MIILREIEEKVNHPVIKIKIDELNVLIPRMETEDSLLFLSSVEFLKGVSVGLKLSVKARQLENFEKESDVIDNHLMKLEKLYIDYHIKRKNEPN